MSPLLSVSLAGALVAVPFVAALVLAAVPSWRAGRAINCAAAALTLLLASLLPGRTDPGGTLLLVDALAAHVVLLTAFVALGAAWFSLFYVEVEMAAGRFDAPRLRVYHALFQCILGGMILAVLSNNFGLTWMGAETVTVAAALAVGLRRTPAAVQAAWRLLVLCGTGIALALFGTVLLYLAAVPSLGPGLAAMSWTGLWSVAPRCDGPLLNLAFAFLLLGYATLAALAPLHTWMPDAQARGPTPVSAVLAGSVLNIALVVILRLRAVMAANDAAIAPGPPIMALGLVSVLLAGFGLWRGRDVKRFFALSSVAQSGLAAFAFGLGGATATFAGLLHMTLHTLTKASIFQCVGRAAQLKGGQAFADLAGLLSSDRRLGLTLAAGVVALAALPPSGLFGSEFLIATETVRRAPALALPLGIGVVVGAGALVCRLRILCFGAPTPDRGPAGGAITLAPAWIALGAVLMLGLAMPAAVTEWMALVAGSAR